jgi:hypothetical protein
MIEWGCSLKQGPCHSPCFKGFGLWLEFHIRKTESDFGIQFLCCLDQVHATIHCNGSTSAFVKALEATMRDQVSQNPNNPVLKITRTGVYSPDTVRGEEHRSTRGYSLANNIYHASLGQNGLSLSLSLLLSS